VDECKPLGGGIEAVFVDGRKWPMFNCTAGAYTRPLFVST
jgi:hypothetical protein